MYIYIYILYIYTISKLLLLLYIDNQFDGLICTYIMLYVEHVHLGQHQSIKKIR